MGRNASGSISSKKNLVRYFLSVICIFAASSVLINTRLADVTEGETSFLAQHLLQHSSAASREQAQPPLVDSGSSKDESAVQQSVRDSDANSGIDSSTDNHDNDDDAKHDNDDAKEEGEAKYDEQNEVDADQGGKHDAKQTHHELAGLKCDAHGGPSEDVAAEMVYWEDIPSDALFKSHFKSDTEQQYMTFDIDKGGFNNIRMNLETMVALAAVTGRTLVLPPDKSINHIHKDEKGRKQHSSMFDFFHMESISNEHAGVQIISMEEFLTTVAMTGQMRNATSGEATFPPYNRTNWDGRSKDEVTELGEWLRVAAHSIIWDSEQCVVAVPKSNDPKDTQRLYDDYNEVMRDGGFASFEKYVGKPFPVDAPFKDRLQENWAGREKLCTYDAEMQAAQTIHFPVFSTYADDDEASQDGVYARLLIHFYALLVFQDWRDDLWTKRFIRDHMRYADKIQCAAARIVNAVRQKARASARQPDQDGLFDSFHIRRGDFSDWYDGTTPSAEEIVEVTKGDLRKGSTVYIATDESNKTFFDPLREDHDVFFLNNFQEELGDLEPRYFGMVDQLVAAKGRTFFGCWFSTFSGYINRLRGYHADNQKLPGYREGIIDSYYYAVEDRYDHMRTYYPVKKGFYVREFPTSWRLIDQSVGNLTSSYEPNR